MLSLYMMASPNKNVCAGRGMMRAGACESGVPRVEEVREKAVKQQGTGGMLTRWRGQLGMKADRELTQKALEVGARL